MTINWEGIEGLQDVIGDVACADCEWRLNITGPDPAAVQRAMSVALADHRRDCHYLVHNDGLACDTDPHIP